MFEVQVVEDRDSFLEEMESICSETTNKTWNAQEETCEWNPEDNSSESVNAGDAGAGSNAAVAAPADVTTGALGALAA
jgi:hypothetical protein